jgi:hypothetical protein
MLRRLGILAVLAAVAALAAASAAPASRSARFGIQDDAWLLGGPGTLDKRVATLQALGVGVVRFTLRWDRVARTRPADVRDPSDPAYVWGAYGDVLDALHAAGIPVVVTLWGSPGWANGGGAANRLPSAGFGDFAYAAATEFPWVRLWTVWNEPNSRTFSVPVSPRLYVRRLLDPAYALLHRANPANRVAGGVTSPRATRGGLSPVAFMAGMHRYRARLDAYAQNPYPAAPRETPTFDPCSWCTTLTMARLPQIRRDVTENFGASTPVWLTEYGYQTNPPDRILGVSYALQATYLGEAALRVWRQAGVTLLIHFLVRDEPALGGWQSGLVSVGGSVKPSYRAFGLPLAQVSRRGRTTVVWGQVRPGHGRRPYVLQRWTGRRWVAVGGSRLTSPTGTFERTLAAPPGRKLRLTSPAASFASPALTVA